MSSKRRALPKDERSSSCAVNHVFEYLDSGPFCMAVLDQRGDDPYFTVEKINEAFERHLSPLFKMTKSNFLTLVSEKHQQSLFEALSKAKESNSFRARARNIEMTTLAECNSGLPIKRHFDWTISKGKDGKLLVFGDPCTDDDVKQRAKDSELIDFFQNAPIALHWLSGEGIVLWANKKELDVLGYTSEEYIGQPIMKFCPDDEEQVLDIFKQLGSGNTIKDVPVRFRTKDGRIVDLLIDSNVRYDDEGKFAHTRCFIRDDTKRKIREARAQLLLEETKRSLVMLDNFMSRSLHHMRTPLHILQTSIDIVLQRIGKVEKRVSGDIELAELVEDCQYLLTQAGCHIHKASDMIEDITSLAKFDQGQQLEISNDVINLKDLGKTVLESSDIPPRVQMAVELSGGGPTFINSDVRHLKKVLCSLLDHVSNEVAPDDFGRAVTLVIGHTADRCIFSIVETAVDAEVDIVALDLKPETRGEGLPAIFQRYHQELLPEEMVNLEAADDLRNKIEAGINSNRTNSAGLGLSLSYHLVLTLGGDLRYSSSPDMTKFWFSLPYKNGDLFPDTSIVTNHTSHIQKLSNQDGNVDSIKLERPTIEQKFTKSEEVDGVPCRKASVGREGLKVMEAPSILVVEDVPIFAKLLCTILRQFHCSTKWVKNGQEAVDLLREEPGMYNLIFMDLRMPVMDGLTATKIIKDELKMTTPVVALTGEGGSEIQEECKCIGFDDYFSKPMKREDLMNAVRKHTGYVYDDKSE